MNYNDDIFKTTTLTSNQLESVFSKFRKWKIKYKYYEQINLLVVDLGKSSPSRITDIIHFFESTGCTLHGSDLKKAKYKILAVDGSEKFNEIKFANIYKELIKK